MEDENEYIRVKEKRIRKDTIDRLRKAFEDVEDVLHDMSIWWADYYNYSLNDIVKVHGDMASGQLNHIEDLIEMLKLNVKALLSELDIDWGDKDGGND